MPNQQTSERWTTLPLALSPLAERLTGADHHPMLYLASEDRYLRLSPGAARLLDALDGDTTTAQILERVGDAGDPALAERRRRVVLETLDGLRSAGAFTLSRGPAADSRNLRVRAWLARSPRLRIKRGMDPVVAGPADLAARHPRVTRASLAIVGLASLVLLVAGVASFPSTIEIMWPVVVVALLVEIVAHELAHAAVCRAYGVRVKEAGVMLWGWFLPLAYVDCTDLYRLPARRPRVMVALAGPFVDLVGAGTAAAVALSTTGETSGTAFMVLVALLLVLARNLTPLLPTDGYFALEAATGELNLRRRAWRHLCASVAQRVRPGRGRRVQTRRERVYLAYGLITALYTIVLFAFIVIELRHTAGAVW